MSSSEHSYALAYERPDVNAFIQGHARTNGSGRLGIIACGPQGMLVEARKAIATVMKAKTRDLDISVASFSW